MTATNWLTVNIGAFLGGAASWGATHLATGLPSGSAQIGAFVLGFVVAGLTSVLHLYQTSPADKQTLARYKAVAAGTALTALALFLPGCSNPRTPADIAIGLDAAVCVLDTYTADISAQQTEAQAIADTIIKCGVSAAQASGVLASHKRAENAEGKLGMGAGK